jgi:ABC-type branched-subunit amino acid transport system ATPase component
VLVGGQTALLGPTLGVFVLYFIPREVIDVEGYSDLIYGAVVLIAVVAFRGGIDQALRNLGRWFERRVRPTTAPAAADGSADAVNESVAASPVATAALAAPVARDELPELLWELRERAGTKPVPLTATAVHKAFGGVSALDLQEDASVTVEPGRVHLLLGPNGSGKTTLLNTMCGLAKVDRGSVRLGDTEVTNKAMSRIAQAGVSRSFQGPKLPSEVSPRDLLSARISQLERVNGLHWLFGDPIARKRRRRSDELAERLALAAGLGVATWEPCLGLTSGQRRIVDVLVALTSNGHTVLLDEPAAGLSQPERQQLGATITALARHGMGFIVVEHDLDLAMSLADSVTVLASGRLLAQGAPAEIQANEDVRRVLMGEDTWTASR